MDPVMAFSILVGLGLDYDIFLLTRIREYRMLGVSDPGQDEANNVQQCADGSDAYGWCYHGG